MQPAGDFVAAAVDDQSFDVEEQIFAGAVVGRAADVVLRHGIERVTNRARVVGRHDALRREHHEMRVVNRHQRREKELLRVLEVLVEHVGDVFRGKLHRIGVYPDL